jgi:hypothetical protein
VWISIFQAIAELVSWKNPNLLLKFLVLRCWGWDLTIVGGQAKTPIVLSIVYGPDSWAPPGEGAQLKEPGMIAVGCIRTAPLL